jgi:integrase
MPRRRANDMGSVYKNVKRGRWEAKYHTLGPDGRRVRKLLTARTRVEVEAKLAEAMGAREAGMPPPDTRQTFSRFATWWADFVLPTEGLAPKTEAWYRYILDRYVIPRIGGRSLVGQSALRPADVETMTGAMMAEGLSHRTAVAARTVAGKVLRAAVERGLAARNVAYIAKRPRDRGRARDVKAFTVKQVAELLDGLDGTPWHPIVVVGVTTGLRPAELLALHWPDVTLGDDPQVSVRHALTYVDGTALKAPKRARSYRTVPLAPEAVAALKAWRRQQAAGRLAAGELWSPDWPGLVFTREDGTPRRVDTFRHALGDVMPGAHPHRLRHTYATHLLEAHTPIHHVAELLGDSVATVEESYSHVLRRKHEVAAVVSGLLVSARRADAT